MESEEVRWKGDMVQRSGREEKHGTDMDEVRQKGDMVLKRI